MKQVDRFNSSRAPVHEVYAHRLRSLVYERLLSLTASFIPITKERADQVAGHMYDRLPQ